MGYRSIHFTKCGQHFQTLNPKGKAAAEEGEIPDMMQSKSEQVVHSESPAAVLKSVAQFQYKMFNWDWCPRSLPVTYRTFYGHSSLLQAESVGQTPMRGRNSLASPNNSPCACTSCN